MSWTQTGDFDALAAGELSDEIAACEDIRRKAMGRYWLWTAVAVVGAIVIGVCGAVGFEPAIGLTAGLVLGIIGLIMAVSPLEKARAAIKQPMCEAIARRMGLSWTAKPGGGPGFADAGHLLFGRPNSSNFSDLWSGQIEGREFAVYEATLTQKSGKSNVTLFAGHIWRLAAVQSWPGTTVIVPDKGVFNFFKPQGGMERVRYPEDAAFERKFEAYATDAMMIQPLLSPALRAELVSIREQVGTTWVYLGGDHVLVAVSGKDRFEPGTMFKSEPGVDRARRIWNEVDGAVGFARRLSAAFPPR